MPPIDMEQLIAEVRARPLLYRRHHEEYNEPESKQRAWRDVAAAVYRDWESVGRSETYERSESTHSQLIAEVRARPLLYRRHHEEYNEPESKQRAWRDVAAAVYRDWESVGRSETYERSESTHSQLIAEVRARPLLYRRHHEEYNEPESKQRAWRDVAAAVYRDWESVGRSETYERSESTHSQLIAEVRARPLLYRRHHEEYNEPESKQRAWRDVAAAVYRDWESVGRSETYERILLLQKKWRSLRDAFNRELRMRSRDGPRSRKKYVYYKPLKFLRQDDAAAKESSSSSEADPLVSPKPKRRHARTRRRRASVKREAASPDDEPDGSGGEGVDAHYEQPAGQPEPSTESDRLFLLSYAEEMQRLPAHVRMWARAQVSRVMQEAVAYCCAGAGDALPAPADVDTRSLQALARLDSPPPLQ